MAPAWHRSRSSRLNRGLQRSSDRRCSRFSIQLLTTCMTAQQRDGAQERESEQRGLGSCTVGIVQYNRRIPVARHTMRFYPTTVPRESYSAHCGLRWTNSNSLINPAVSGNISKYLVVSVISRYISLYPLYPDISLVVRRPEC